jgi:SAM-dependent methyltransferase
MPLYSCSITPSCGIRIRWQYVPCIKGVSVHQPNYIMENDEEAIRLDLKTDRKNVNRQALWAGLQPGMRVADIGCGSGITTSFLHDLIQPDGEVLGIDFSETRILYAEEHYGRKGIDFICKDTHEPLSGVGEFDFIWVRFLLEYHQSRSTDIVNNLFAALKPGGILCLIDLDYNCLSHFGLSPRLEKSINGVMDTLGKDCDFDPYAGRKLYSYLYDLGCRDIAVDMTYHHLIYGELNDTDAYNWTRKVEVAAKKSGYSFNEYDGGYAEFFEEFKRFFSDPRRFTYTPIISCKGHKP